MAQMRFSVDRAEQARDEALWAAEEGRRVAVNAFRASRRLALARRWRASLGPRRSGRAEDAPAGKPCREVALDEITGLAGAAHERALPPLPMVLEEAWIAGYAELESEDEPFSLRREAGTWLLEGGMRELLRLELLRSRGDTFVRLGSRAEPGLAVIEREPIGRYSCPECGGLIAG